MKRIVAIGTALVFMLSAVVTASAGNCTPCIGRVIRAGGLCWNGENCYNEHCWFRHNSERDCGFWGVDVQGICGNWRYTGDGAVYSQQGADEAARRQSTTNAVPENQPGADAVPSQPKADPAAGNQAESQTGNKAAPDTDAYGAGTGNPYYGDDAAYGYGYGAHHGESNCYSGGYRTGCHGSGHHGRGHH